MKELNLYCPTGWMNGLYHISTNQNELDKYKNKLNVNNLFWNRLFDTENILTTVKNAKNRFNEHDNVSEKIRAAINEPQIFIELLTKSINKITYDNLSSEEVFCSLETIQIFCDIYSLLHNSAFKLSVDSGYICENVSSKYLYQNCLSNSFNPYLSFIEEEVMPIIILHKPDIVWFEGKISIASFAIARLIREKFPNAFIAISKHSNEYFSLNKILPLLKKNNYLFDAFDCIVLDESFKTKQNIIEAIQKGNTRNVKNIAIKQDAQIFINDFKSDCFNSAFEYIKSLDIHTNKAVNIKLFPNNHCYWNKCGFCGINKKYLFCQSNSVWDIDFAIEVLKILNENGVNSFWAIDEAIPINILVELSKRIINEKLKFRWHVRTRIEPQLTEEKNICILKESGLVHILLGLESTSNRVVRMINKTNIENYTEITEKIISTFNKHEIKIHCPVIIGFPNERSNERTETFHFLERMTKTYRFFSYNINIFYLDIGSEMFKYWTNYNITSVCIPCEPNCFIGNNVNWTSSNKLSNTDLFALVDKYMKKLFDWYPDDALIPINTFFMMLENMKHSLMPCKEIINNDSDKQYQIGELDKYISVFKNKKGLFCLYNLKNHQNIICTKEIYDVVTNYSLKSMKDGLNILEEPIKELIAFMKEANFFKKGGENDEQT